jgi:hypothetical protein
MSGHVHRVRRQRWSIRAETPEQALGVRQWLRDNAEGSVNAALTAAFDAAAPGKELVRLDRIQLTLRLHRIEDLLDVLPQRASAALHARMKDVSTAPGSADDDDATLIAYLLTGQVPWPTRPDDTRIVSTLAARARVSAPRMIAAIAQRAANAGALGDAMFRLLQLVDESEWGSLLDAVAGRSPWPALPAREAGEHSTHGSRDRRLRLVVSRVSGARRDGAAANTAVVVGPADAGGGQSGGPGSSPSSRPASGFAAAPTQDLVEAALAHLTPAAHLRGAPYRGLETAQSGSDSLTGGRLDFSTAVHHAGLVLLHPFLPQLFRAAGFEPVRAWDPSRVGTARAAALLHFAASGDEEPYELQLGMIKLLLGVAPDTPLPVAGGLLTGADRDEVHAMLTAVVEHWQALKRTSVAALRTSFLRRPGLVRRDDNGWRLQVEPSSFDVLITRVPWSLSLVKLPWMPIPIHVDWTTH